MANPTLQLHFGCGRATPPVSHSHNWPSGRMQNFLFKIGQKSYFLPIKTQKTIWTLEWYYRSLYCRSNAMSLKKMANLKAISSSATLSFVVVTVARLWLLVSSLLCFVFIIGPLYDLNSSAISAAFMRQWTGPSLVQIMACRLFGAKPLPELNSL